MRDLSVFVESFVIFSFYMFQTVLLLRDLSFVLGTVHFWEIFSGFVERLNCHMGSNPGKKKLIGNLQ